MLCSKFKFISRPIKVVHHFTRLQSLVIFSNLNNFSELAQIEMLKMLSTGTLHFMNVPGVVIANVLRHCALYRNPSRNQKNRNPNNLKMQYKILTELCTVLFWEHEIREVFHRYIWQLRMGTIKVVGKYC